MSDIHYDIKQRIMQKSGFLFFVFLLAANALLAQNLKTDSIFHWGKTGWELPADMTTDAEGNFYVNGSFSGEMTIGNQLVKSNGKRDIFLAKFSKDNQLQWAKNLGGEGDDNAYSLLCSGNNLYLTGSFRKQMGFNNGAIKLAGKGLTDVFLAKLGADGSVLWAKAITSEAPAQKAFLQSDSIGNIWLAGSFSKPVGLAETKMGSGDQKGVYYLAYNPSGNLEKSGYFTGSSEVSLNGFVMGKRQLCFAGSFSGDMEISGKSISSNGKSDGFVAQLNTESKVFWIKNLGGEFDDEIKCVALDNQDNLYVAGDFKYAIDLDKAYTALQNTDIFVVKYTPDGKMSWSRQLGAEGESYNTVTDLEMAADGKFFLSGAFRGKLQNNPEVKSLGNSKNAFLARYTTDGKKDWVLGTNSMNENKLWIKYNQQSGGLHISGYFSEGFKLGDYELKNQNYKDIFFGSLVDCDLAGKVKLGPDTTLCTGIELEAKGKFATYLWSTGETKESAKLLSSGEYNVQATDKYGCTSSDTVKIQILPAPVLDLGADATLCKGQSKQLMAAEGFSQYLWDNGSTENQRTLDETGHYWLQVTDSLGCSAVDSLNLTVNPLPEFSLGADIQLNPADTLELEPMLAPGEYHYLWSTGSTQEKLIVPARNLANQSVIGLTVSDQNLCSYTGQVMVLLNNSGSAANGLEGDGGYRLFPNPTSGKFYIYPTGNNLPTQVDIYDMRGILFKSLKNVSTNPVEIDLSGVGKGTYLVKISKEKMSREFRVVVK